MMLNMRFKILLLDDSPTHTGAEILLATDDAAAVAKLRGLLTATTKPVERIRAGAKGRQVIVVGKSDDCEVPVEAQMIFPTAMDASAALGYAHNAVAQSLKKAQATGEDSAVLRGVEFKYVDTIRV